MEFMILYTEVCLAWVAFAAIVATPATGFGRLLYSTTVCDVPLLRGMQSDSLRDSAHYGCLPSRIQCRASRVASIHRTYCGWHCVLSPFASSQESKARGSHAACQ